MSDYRWMLTRTWIPDPLYFFFIYWAVIVVVIYPLDNEHINTTDVCKKFDMGRKEIPLQIIPMKRDSSISVMREMVCDVCLGLRHPRPDSSL